MKLVLAVVLTVVLAVLSGCQVLEPTVPQTTTTTERPTAKEIELKYDDGIADQLFLAGPNGGHLVRFSLPSTLFAIRKVKVYGVVVGTGWEGRDFEVQVWDKSRNVLWSKEYPFTLFPTGTLQDWRKTIGWIELEVPSVEVTEELYIHVWTNSVMRPEPLGIGIGGDLSGINEGSEATMGYKVNQFYPPSKEKVNWMIRVTGESVTGPASTPALTPAPTTTPTPAPAPITDGVELKYDDGVPDSLFFAGPNGGHLIYFSAPSMLFAIKRVNICGVVVGTGWEGRNFEVQVWDNNRKVLWNREYPFELFPVVSVDEFRHEKWQKKIRWVELEVPDVEVTGEFYVHVWTNGSVIRPEPQGIGMGTDQSGMNSGSEGTVSYQAKWTYPALKERINWMIRVQGTATKR